MKKEIKPFDILFPKLLYYLYIIRIVRNRVEYVSGRKKIKILTSVTLNN